MQVRIWLRARVAVLKLGTPVPVVDLLAFF